MSSFVFANNVSTTLADAITSTSATSMTLASTANFPTIPGGYYWAVTLSDAATRSTFEIVYVTSISGAVCTILRGQEGTAAATWLVGDYAYGAVTAGELGGFVQGGGNFVELSPGSAQSGYIDVTGAITGAAGTFVGVAVGGALTTATTGSFSGDVTADDFLASRAYAGTSLANLPLRVNGLTGVIGIGASSALTANGVTASALAIGLAGSSNFVTVDNEGNLGTTGNVYGTDGIFSTEVTAPTILQDGTQVIDVVASAGDTIAVTTSGGNVNVESPIVVCNARIRFLDGTNQDTPLSSGYPNFANFPTILGGFASPVYGSSTAGVTINIGWGIKAAGSAQTLSGSLVGWSNGGAGSTSVYLDGALQTSGSGLEVIDWSATIPNDGDVHQLIFIANADNINGFSGTPFLPVNSIGGLDTTKIALVQAGT